VADRYWELIKSLKGKAPPTNEDLENGFSFTYEEDPPVLDDPIQWMDPRSLPLALGSEGKDSPSSVNHDPDTCTWCQNEGGQPKPETSIPGFTHDPHTCPYCLYFSADTMAVDASACEEDCECRQFDPEDAVPLIPRDFPGDAPRWFEDAFSRIFDQAYDLLVEKQEAYGPENVRELGFYGVFSRLASDKVNRLRNLMNGTLANGKISIDWADTNDESVEDTLLDIANYALILVALQRGWWGLPLADDYVSVVEDD
jgi:hypothetical protein